MTSLVPLFVSAVPAQAATGSLTVTTLGRGGGKVGETVTVIAVSSGETHTVASGKKLALSKGRYIAMTDIYESAKTGLGTDTIGAQVVSVSGNTSVTLDARKGKPVKVSLNTPADVTDPPEISAQVCAAKTDMPSAFSTGGWNIEGSLYAIPNSSKELQFGYLAHWTGKDTYLASGNTTGIPAKPGGSFKLSSLAKVHFAVRGGPEIATQHDVALQRLPSVSDCTTDLLGDVRDDQAPYSANAYVTPGRWQPRDDIFADNGDVGGGFPAARTLHAGKTVNQYFGRAVFGPVDYLPTVYQKSVTFLASNLIADSDVAYNTGGTTKETVVLHKGSKVVKKQTLTDWGNSDPEFSARIHSAAWYSLSVDAHHYRPGITFPAGMLSSRVTINWRFKADPAKQVVAPAFLSRFLPAGLNSHNQAAPSSTTTVTVTPKHSAQGPDVKFATVAVKSLKVWASSDGGRTWHAVTVKHSGTNWLATVHNPASGAVALRSQVMDAQGDSSVETVYRAYAIS